MMNLILKSALLFLLRNKGRGRISLGYPGSMNNNDIYIQLIYNKKFYTIDSIKDSEITCLYYKNDAKYYTSIKLKYLKKFKIEITHYFKDWIVTYNKIYEAFFNVFFGIIKFKKWKYDHHIKDIELFHDRMKLLKILLKINSKSKRPILDIKEICEELYGKKYMMYQSYPHIKEYNNLKFGLLSLKQSGDIKFNDEVMFKDIIILPKSLETISNYEIDMSKHISSLRITRYQLYVMIFMALITLLNLLLVIINFNMKK